MWAASLTAGAWKTKINRVGPTSKKQNGWLVVVGMGGWLFGGLFFHLVFYVMVSWVGRTLHVPLAKFAVIYRIHKPAEG